MDNSTILTWAIILVVRIIEGFIAHKIGKRNNIKWGFVCGFLFGILVFILALIQMNSISRHWGISRTRDNGWNEEIQWYCPQCGRINYKRYKVCPCGYSYKEYEESLKEQRMEKYREEKGL